MLSPEELDRRAEEFLDEVLDAGAPRMAVWWSLLRAFSRLERFEARDDHECGEA